MDPLGGSVSLLSPDYPRIGVGVCVFKAGRLLLIRRAKPPRAGEWSLPGGAQELGETVAAAGRREVFEETGVDAAILGIVDVVDLIERAGPDGPLLYHFTLIDLVADWRAGEPRAASDATDAKWVEINALAAHALWEETDRVARLAFTLWRAAAGC